MTIENDSHDTRLDTALERLRDRGADAPAPGAALEAMLRDIAPVKTRNPRRQFAIVAVAAAAYVTAIVLVAHLRIDLDGLPMPWFVATAAAWAAILAESEAEAEARLFVSGDEIKRELHESLARMDSGVGLTWRRGAYT